MSHIPDDPSVVEPVFHELKANFLTHHTKNVAFRKQQLKNLIKGHQELQGKFDEALKQDLGYSPFLSKLLSHGVTENEMAETLNHIDEWTRSESIDTPLAVGLASTKLTPEPLGVILVLAAWNYPVYTALPFVACAIAAGNCVLLKPSEMAPATSHVLLELFNTYLDKRFYRCLEGKVEVAKTLTNLKFDSILFTGSTQTGRFVAMAAAKNLVPCVLELGGKCPVIVDESASLEAASKRILMGKYTNCGQTCVGVDHVFVHASIKEKFTQILLKNLKEFYPNSTNSNADMGKIITRAHVERLESYIKENHGGKILHGGNISHDNQFIEPTVIDSPKLTSTLMNEQIFGPIMPLLPYENLDEIISLINSRPKPLVVYMFSENKKNIQKVEQLTSSGAFVNNDAIMQMFNTKLPFGGVGFSGYGRYHGKHGFDACSNPKSIMKSVCMDPFPLTAKFPPYTPQRQQLMGSLLKIGGITYSSIGRFLLVAIFLGSLVFALKKYGVPRL